MGHGTRRWAMATSGASAYDPGSVDLYGRVWTDPREMSPWVVLLDRPGGPAGGDPRLVFRRGDEEWTSPVPAHVRLAELGDDLLRRYLERARGR